MVENYSATPDQLMLDWNCVGATARYHGQNRAFEFRLWERSDGHLGMPDMTVIIIRISFRGTQGGHPRRDESIHPLAETNRQNSRVGSDKPSPLLRGPPLR